MGTSGRVLAAKLRSIAMEQQGFFTAGQAVSAGYADSVHKYHVDNGDWVKEYRGIYRLADAERSAWGDLVVMSLWSRGRDDKPQGVFSRETALGVWGVVDLDTEVLHMTVPMRFRKNCEVPAKLNLTKEDLFPRDIERKDGFLVTSLEKAIEDVRNACTNPKILAAIRQIGHIPGLGFVQKSLDSTPFPAAIQVAGTKFDDWDDPWNGVIQSSGWGSGMTFEDALRCGQD